MPGWVDGNQDSLTQDSARASSPCLLGREAQGTPRILNTQTHCSVLCTVFFFSFCPFSKSKINLWSCSISSPVAFHCILWGMCCLWALCLQVLLPHAYFISNTPSTWTEIQKYFCIHLPSAYPFWAPRPVSDVVSKI